MNINYPTNKQTNKMQVLHGIGQTCVMTLIDIKQTCHEAHRQVYSLPEDSILGKLLLISVEREWTQPNFEARRVPPPHDYTHYNYSSLSKESSMEDAPFWMMRRGEGSQRMFRAVRARCVATLESVWLLFKIASWILEESVTLRSA